MAAAGLVSKLRRFVPLSVEQRGEVALVDPRMGGRGNGGLGVKGNAQSSAREHGEIVGAVAGSERFRQGNIVFRLNKRFERFELRRGSQHRLFDEARQFAVFDDEHIGNMGVQSRSSPRSHA